MTPAQEQLGNLIFLVVFVAVAIPMLIAFLGGAPFVPTPQPVVDEMLRLSKVKRGEVVVDPGCGDGRMVITAAKQYGAKATGYELFFIAYLMAKWRNMLNGFPARIKFANSKKIDYSKVNVIMCYLLPDNLPKWKVLWEKQLPHGARIASYAFPIKGWTPTIEIPRNPEKRYGPIRIYEIGRTG